MQDVRCPNGSAGECGWKIRAGSRMLVMKTTYGGGRASRVWLQSYWPVPVQQYTNRKQKLKLALIHHSTQAQFSMNENKTRKDRSNTNKYHSSGWRGKSTKAYASPDLMPEHNKQL